MAEAEKKEIREEREKTRPRKSRKGLLLGGILLLVFCLLGSAVFFAVKIGYVNRLLAGMMSVAPLEAAVSEPAYTYEIPEIVVNLSDGDRRRFLSVKFYVGYDESKLEEEFERRMPEIRDAVLGILWEKSAEEIYTPEGKENLRQEIREVINNLVKSGEIKGVYFWHVMVQ